MNLLVTSGSGFIGSNLVHYLSSDASRELGVEIERVAKLYSVNWIRRIENGNYRDERLGTPG